MLCLDGPVSVKGERGGSEYSYLQVVYEICGSTMASENLTRNCHSKEEISNWLQDKSIIILENEHKFITDNYESPIAKQSRVKLLKIFPNGSWKYLRIIRSFKLLLSDSLLSIGLLF